MNWPKQYVRKPQPVMAAQYDGTTAGAYVLLGWLLGLKGTSGYFRSGVENQGPDGPVVAAGSNDENRFVLKDEWVVYTAGGGGTRVVSPEQFAGEYEPAPQAAPVMPQWHHGHGPGCRCLKGTRPRNGLAEQRDGAEVAGQDGR